MGCVRRTGTFIQINFMYRYDNCYQSTPSWLYNWNHITQPSVNSLQFESDKMNDWMLEAKLEQKKMG